MVSPRVAVDVIRRVWTHPANRDDRTASLGRFAAWQIWQRVARRPLSVRAFGDMEIHLRPGSHSAAAVFYTRLPDYAEMSFLRDAMRPGDGFLDVGANVGIYSLLAASIAGRDTPIVAVEPVDATRWHLLEHIAANRLSATRVVSAAVGSRSGWVKMTSELGSMNHVLRFVSEPPTEDGWSRCMTLDEICRGHLPTFGKMDIEGYELEAFAGAEALVRAKRPAAWIIEINHMGQRYGNDDARLRAWIEAHGGELCRYDAHARRLIPARATGSGEETNAIAVFDRPFVDARLAEAA